MKGVTFVIFVKDVKIERSVLFNIQSTPVFQVIEAFLELDPNIDLQKCLLTSIRCCNNVNTVCKLLNMRVNSGGGERGSAQNVGLDDSYNELGNFDLVSILRILSLSAYKKYVHTTLVHAHRTNTHAYTHTNTHTHTHTTHTQRTAVSSSITFL